MLGQIKDHVQSLSPAGLDALAKGVKDLARKRREQIKTAEQEAARLKVEEDKFDKKVGNFDEELTILAGHIEKVDQELKLLYEDRGAAEKLISDKIPSGDALKSDVSPGGLIDQILKEPMKEHKGTQRETNIKRLELHAKNLHKLKDEKLADKKFLVQEHDNEAIQKTQAATKQADLDLQKQSCEQVRIVADSYKVAEDSLRILKRNVALIQGDGWIQDIKKLGPYPDAYLQLFGSVLAKGRIDSLEFMDFIGYLSSYNLFGDRDSPEAYARISGQKHLEEPVFKDPLRVRAEEPQPAQEPVELELPGELELPPYR